MYAMYLMYVMTGILSSLRVICNKSDLYLQTTRLSGVYIM